MLKVVSLIVLIIVVSFFSYVSLRNYQINEARQVVTKISTSLRLVATKQVAGDAYDSQSYQLECSITNHTKNKHVVTIEVEVLVGGRSPLFDSEHKRLSLSLQPNQKKQFPVSLTYVSGPEQPPVFKSTIEVVDGISIVAN